MHWNKLILLIILSATTLLSCKKTSTSLTDISPAISYSDYEEDWLEIEKMENKGLGKSIIEKSDEILKKALAENNINQVFKAMAYRSKYSNHIEEESTLHILSAYEQQVKAANFPLKQLLHSALAELYFQYYNQNRWRFSQRTATINFEPADIRSWDLDRINAQIVKHYQASLEPKSDLSQVPISSLKLILNLNHKDSTLQHGNLELRPSLYDFLADRALQHFNRNEGSLNKPINEFNLDNYAVFASIEDFISLPFKTTDTNSSNLRSSMLYQELLRLHQKDKNPSVLIDFNLDRLKFAYSQSTKELKDSLYLTALKRFLKANEEAEMADEIAFEIAQLYFQWGNQYEFDDETNNKQWYLKKAHNICASKKGKNTFGSQQCNALKTKIEKTTLQFQLENTYLPNRPILFRLTHQNIDSIYFRLIQVPFDLENYSSFENREAFIRNLLKLAPKKTWVELPEVIGDFQQHAIELYTPGIKRGNYFLLASENKDFDDTSEQIAYANFQVSELAYFSRRNPDGNSVSLFALNRKTGEPLEAIKVLVYSNNYEYSSRNKHLKQVATYQTNREGFVSIANNTTSNQLQFSLVSALDTLGLSSNYYLYHNPKNKRTSLSTYFFTDRAIYRPGQTVYFKGIVIESNDNNTSPKANYQSTVSLYNVNGEKLNSISIKTNEYGSYQGSFVLPQAGLNGQYRIQDKHGMQRFSVEEYKRPTFHIALDSAKKEQKINELVKLGGEVKAYSGALVSGAKLRYRVYRKATFPYWSYFRSNLPSANQKEIAFGSVTSNEKGAFSIEFLAQADPSIQEKWNPVYNYQLVLDATSPSGETQSLNENIQLSSQSLFLTSNLDETIQFEAIKNLVINAQNINGHPVKTSATLSLWKLKPPESPKKSKLWAAVDQTGIDKKEFQKNFPDYPINEEELMISSFPKDYEISRSSIECNKQLNLFRELTPGAYELTVETTDKYGEKVALKKRFNLIDIETEKLPYPIFSLFEVIKNEGEPGDSAIFLIGSSLKQLRLLFEVEHDNKIIYKRWVSLNNRQQTISIPIKEKYRGGFSVYFTGIHSDRMIRFSENISVPFSNKKLSLHLETFRDKIPPGSQERWTLSLTGDKGGAVVAELLAGMYDQSLDQFKQDTWNLNLYHANYKQLSWDQNNSFNSSSSQVYSLISRSYSPIPLRTYPSLNWFGFSLGYENYGRNVPMLTEGMSMTGIPSEKEGIYKSLDRTNVALEEALIKKDELAPNTTTTASNPIRSDFRETVFFYPQLSTNDSGKVSFEFTMPDALTQWKFRGLAHTKDLKVGSIAQSIRTQKKLMVIPNVPRFFREGDEMEFTSLINNLSEHTLSGFATLQFYDAIKGEKIDIFNGNSADKKFEIQPRENTTVSWSIKIPKGIKAIAYRIEGITKSFKDGEEKAVPVIPKRMLVTESVPIWVRGNETKMVEFEKLVKAEQQETLSHESFTLEFTANPAWYAIQALPNLSEHSDECSEQVFSRLYANSLAEKIANSNPKIKAVFEQWKSTNSEELTSKLFQNKELKSILIEETPWLQLAKSETEQKKRIALLFDYNQLALEKTAAIDKLSQLQLPNGGWAWYKGMIDNHYITQYIVEGLGHLKKLGVEFKEEEKLNALLVKAIQYLDERAEDDYKKLLANKVDLDHNNLGRIQIHYLYTRSFFQEIPLPLNNKSYEYYIEQAQNFWLNRSIYEQGLLGLAVHRILPESTIPSKIQLSLMDHAINDKEMGMYWKNNRGGYYWYQAPIETQALMIELFEEHGHHKKLVEELKIWLLKQKQTQAWSNSKATAAACYALLLSGNNDLSSDLQVSIKVGKEQLALSSSTTEAGTGYFKKVWDAAAVKPELGKIKVEKKDDGIGWGAAYWQFYQDLDKISSAKTEGLQLSKDLFKISTTEKGEMLEAIDATAIKLGDKIKVRIQLELDRNMEFVHLKDMRAAAFEPISVISRYKFQDGLGYYESTKDASTNFFMDRLPKGVYVFEYELRASQVGEFSNGISTIQCQYAPEFSSHSKGVKVKIEK